MNKVNIVVIGGGTGTFVVLSGLKNFTEFNITALVSSTDSGGSTGILRDEFGILPPGDLRQCLVALSTLDPKVISLRDLFNYRFDRGGEGIKGHSFGNLFLTALTDITKSEIKAIKIAKKILKVRGDVFPITLNKCNLCAEYENGEILCGEHEIDEPKYPHNCNLRIKKVFLDKNAEIYSEAKKRILNADIILIGPGDLYTSLIANLVVNGVSESISESKGKFIYVVNLVTKFGQTTNYTAKDHLDEITKYAKKEPDFVFINSSKLPDDILEKYRLENAFPVIDDLPNNQKNIVRGDFLASEIIKKHKGDILRRSLIRHDGYKISREILNILNRYRH